MCKKRSCPDNCDCQTRPSENEAAQELERAKLEFLSTSSHELRTPLASISLAAELLLRGGVAEIDPKQKFFLEEIYINAQKMSQLITTFMDLARIEMGALSINPEPIAAVPAIEKILDEMEIQIANKNLSLRKSFDRTASAINCDKKIFTVVLDNLLSNALKYTKPGGELRLSVQEAGDQIEITVQDSGIGITPEDLPYIFNKQFRAKSAVASHQEGNGLGLYVVKSLLDKTEAKIEVKSELGKGSQFKVYFPKAENCS